MAEKVTLKDATTGVTVYPQTLVLVLHQTH